MSKKIAIVQSCYIPWKGYFNLINMVDEFILYDDMQYTKRDWRNRNLIKTPNGLDWLTIHVDVKGKYFQRINETMITDKSWAQKHWKSLTANYGKAKYFKQYKDIFQALYLECEQEESLSKINFLFLQAICSLLNIKTKLSWSTDYPVDDDLRKTERLVALCQQAKATHYISGPAAKVYMQTDLFNQVGVSVSYIDYSSYTPYEQLFGSFEHGVTILDLIFNAGPDAFFKSTQEQREHA
jgi:hypothetical protein